MKHTLPVSRTARFFTHNEVSGITERIWLVFHGYGQLAEYFVRHFEMLGPRHAVIAPEGLSRFYVEGLTGRVGASWMTSDDRETEIADQHTLIDTILNRLGVSPSDPRLCLLGFSQGTTTAVRWMYARGVRPAKLVLWAGSLPHDVPLPQMAGLLTNTQVHYCLGDQDQFITTTEAEKRLAEVRAHMPQLRMHFFEGAHVMHGDTLREVCDG